MARVTLDPSISTVLEVCKVCDDKSSTPDPLVPDTLCPAALDMNVNSETLYSVRLPLPLCNETLIALLRTRTDLVIVHIGSRVEINTAIY